MIQGHARFDSPTSLAIEGGEVSGIDFEQAIIATGSSLNRLPDGIVPSVWSSADALKLPHVPESLLVVGGGYIGLELGSVWMRLGAKVTIIEMLPKIAATLDGQVGRTLDRILRKQGLAMRLKTRVKEAKPSAKKVKVTLEKEGAEETRYSFTEDKTGNPFILSCTKQRISVIN